ncbi:HNH endonuclease [Enterobacter ludwigii]|uniref:HNH endonuclease n=1 Tax=Enterobacter ludwigii TaxID=299767 RepID=UPI002A8070E1|nr:HNH endonuclease [Enterobacter ludwigii]
MDLSRERLMELLSYSPVTGRFTWIKSGPGVTVGKVAGNSSGNKGYVRIKIDGHLYLAHRLAWLYVYGSWPKEEIDHVNLIRDDNRISNLREASRAQNSRNKHLRKDNSSGDKGVYWHKGSHKWQVSSGLNGNLFYLGLYDDKELACLVASEFRSKYHQEFSSHGKG